jgi:hypothetical protein
MTKNRFAAGAAVCSAVLLVSACGGGTAASSGAAAAPTTAASGGSGARGFPGATGLLAQIDGTTLQVQGTDTQTAVTYSPTTTFSDTVAATRSSVVVGACVQARSARLVAGPGGSAPTAVPGATAGPVEAATVEISSAVNGGCSAFGGFRTPGTRPLGAPDPGRTRGPGAGGNGFAELGAFGKVTAVNGASFTVESTPRQNGTATAAPTTRIVRTTAATTYTRTSAASAKALAVGLCVTALGKSSDTGSIAATSISLRPAQNGSCSSGFGRGGPGGIPTSPPGGGSGA